MTVNVTRVVIAMLAAGAISGCATVSRTAGFQDVKEVTEQRTGLQVHWNQGRLEDVVAAESIHALLKEELRADAAVQIALLNNRSLQGTFEEMGIAQADLVQAGLLKNPIFAGHVRFPNKSGEATNTEFSISQDFMDLFLRPLRTKLAAAQFEQAKLQVSDSVLKLTAEVRSAYYAAQGAEHTRKMLHTIVEAAQTAAELAERQHAAGNISDLELANQQVAYQQTAVDLTRSEEDVLAAREHLNLLMGLEGNPSWRISEDLPALPGAEPSAEDLETQALSQRLDLAAARQEIKILEQTLALARRGVIPSVNVGLDTERDTDRTRVTGPSFDVELPVFDRKQAAIARAGAQLRQGRRRLSALETQIRSEVRAAWNRVFKTRELVERYRTTLIPLREKIVAESQKHQNFMLIGVFQLLQAKREEVNAYREYVEVFRDYWNVRTDLERAVGGRLVSEPAPQPTAASAEQSPMQESAMPEGMHAHHHGGHS